MALIGLDSLTDIELRAMMEEEDSDGDDALNENVLCVLMIKLSLTFTVEAENGFTRPW